MAEYRQFTRQELRRNAAIVVAVIVAFSLVFIFGVRHLDQVAHLAQQAADRQGRQEQEEPAAAFDPADVPSEPFYVLLIGSDSLEGTALYTGKEEGASADHRADAVTLVRVDAQNHLVTLVTVPRDTVVDGRGGKVCDTLLGKKPERTVDAVEDITGVDIDYYLMTTFTSFELLVDSLGGVTVDVPTEVTVTDPLSAEPVTVGPGRYQTLTGAEALVLARAVGEYGANGDVTRQGNVRALEVAMMSKVIGDPQDSAAFVEALRKYVETDMDAGVLAATAASFVANADEVVFYSCTGPHDGTKDKHGSYVIEEDAQAWEALMAVVDAGDDPADALSDYYAQRDADE